MNNVHFKILKLFFVKVRTCTHGKKIRIEIGHARLVRQELDRRRPEKVDGIYLIISRESFLVLKIKITFV